MESKQSQDGGCMQGQFDTWLKEIKQSKMDGLNLSGNVIYPHYQGLSLLNIPGSVCRWLSAEPFGASPLTDSLMSEIGGPFQHVVLLLMDGFGLDLYQKMLAGDFGEMEGSAAWQSISERAMLAPLTSVLPSTTSAALTTLWTGKAPAEHGIIGYEVWLKEYGMIANMIFHAPSVFFGETGSLSQAGFSPTSFLPVPTLGTHLVNQGIEVSSLMHNSIMHSGLSEMHLPGVKQYAYRSVSDLLVTLKNLLSTKTHQKTYTYLYWSTVDTLSHRFGPEDERVVWEVSRFGLSLERFLKEQEQQGSGDTLFLILADHGQIYTPPRETFELRRYPKFLSHLIMVPTCENRLPFLFVRSGHEEALLHDIETIWPGQFEVVDGRTALESGVFGDPSSFPEINDRVGDFVVFPKEDHYWWWADKPNPLLGRHGGLNPREMLIPLLAMKL